jgi:hypothetical protein
MNLPSDPQAQKKDWPTPSGTPISAGYRQGTDFKSSILAGESDRSIPTKIGSQTAPWRSFLALGVVSVGLHLLALRIPIPAMQSVAKINQPIKVTQLAVPPKPKRLPKKSIPKPTPLPTSAKPKALESSVRLQNRSGGRAAIAPRRKSSALKTAPSSPKPNEPNSPAVLSDPLGSKQDRQSNSDFKDFPTYEDSVPSPESPAISTTRDYKKVVEFFDQALLADRKQKWQATALPLPLADSKARKVYRVKKGEAIKYLNVFSKASLGTAYVLTDQPTTLEALQKQEEAIANISDILADLKVSPADSSLIAQADLFKRGDSEIISTDFMEATPLDKVADTFRAPLIKNGFKESKPFNYGGGPVYAFSRDRFTGYLNLVPSKDGTGTVIVFWKVPPA